MQKIRIPPNPLHRKPMDQPLQTDPFHPARKLDSLDHPFPIAILKLPFTLFRHSHAQLIDWLHMGSVDSIEYD